MQRAENIAARAAWAVALAIAAAAVPVDYVCGLSWPHALLAIAYASMWVVAEGVGANADGPATIVVTCLGARGLVPVALVVLADGRIGAGVFNPAEAFLLVAFAVLQAVRAFRRGASGRAVVSVRALEDAAAEPAEADEADEPPKRPRRGRPPAKEKPRPVRRGRSRAAKQ